MAIAPSALPRISLVTPSLNAERTISRTLHSVEAQAYPNLQVICVDGDSADSTLDIIKRNRHIVSHIIHGKDKNAAEAINKGFSIADGEIFCYLNADDALCAHALTRVANIFLNEPDIDVVTGACHRVFADGSEEITQVPANFLEILSMRNAIEQPSTFWRATAHRRAGTLDESYALAFDWEWWNRLHASGANIRRTPEILSEYYFSDDNLTSRGGLRVIDEMYRVTKTYGPFGGYLADVYRFLFDTFDMRGYYDQSSKRLPLAKRLWFGGVRIFLSLLFGRQAINSYNWNWASKQIRGLVWYK